MPPRRRALLAVAGAAATLLPMAPAGPADALANPGQPVNNDYGQSIAEVNAEVTAAVSANAKVVAARAAYASAHATTVARRAAEVRAKATYLAAVRSRVAIRITRTKKAYYAAHAATQRAVTVETAARTHCAAVLASVTAGVRALHFRPVDGTFVGRLVSYGVPTVPFSLEKMQVRISVYGGHVSDVTVVAQAADTSDSAIYNNRSLSKLVIEAISARDTATIAAVSGASLSSEAFTQSLESALISAGFKG